MSSFSLLHYITL